MEKLCTTIQASKWWAILLGRGEEEWFEMTEMCPVKCWGHQEDKQMAQLSKKAWRV